MSEGSAVTIGVFDGVHAGHQSVIGHCVQVAGQAGLRAVAVTFDPNPLELLRPEIAPTRLCSLARRVRFIEQVGVADVEVLAFTAELAAMSAQDFVEKVLVRQLNAKHVVIGKGFRFGHKAQGAADTLRAAGLTVDEFALVGDGEPVSSTRVRAAIARGDVAGATQMLTRPPELEGVVVTGHSRGRDLGFPTANLELHRLAAIPADGVYAGAATVGPHRFAAAISVGTNPTFGDVGRTVEAYLLDFDSDLYDQTLRVEFVSRLRDTLAFESVDALVTQMHRDVEATRRVVS